MNQTEDRQDAIDRKDQQIKAAMFYILLIVAILLLIKCSSNSGKGGTGKGGGSGDSKSGGTAENSSEGAGDADGQKSPSPGNGTGTGETEGEQEVSVKNDTNSAATPAEDEHGEEAAPSSSARRAVSEDEKKIWDAATLAILYAAKFRNTVVFPACGATDTTIEKSSAGIYLVKGYYHYTGKDGKKSKLSFSCEVTRNESGWTGANPQIW